jgi:hypothetical protein
MNKFTPHPFIVFFPNHGCLLSIIILFSCLSFVCDYLMVMVISCCVIAL